MKIKYLLTNANGNREVLPRISKDDGITWTKDSEYKIDYKREIKDLTFIGDDFRYFLNMEQSDDRCDQQFLDVIIECGINMPDITPFNGRFSMSEGEWDLDKCLVKFKVKEVDEYSCIEDNDDDINGLFPAPFGRPFVDLTVDIGREVIWCCNNCNSGPDKCDSYDFEEGLYTFWKEFDLLGQAVSIYVRLTLDVPCDEPIPDGWVLSKDCENGTKRIATRYSPNPEDPNRENISDIYGTFHQYDPKRIDNGMMLYDFLNHLVQSSCGLNTYKIVSEFFQWNVFSSSLINYVTIDFNVWTKLMIFQKSDVKRRNAQNNATNAPANAKKMIENICKIFNCRYRINDGILRIEHVSYFENNLGLDVLEKDTKGLLRGTRKYSYDSNKLPKYEKFEFMESGYEAFSGVPIEYDSACVNNDKENESTVIVDNITTDLMYVIANSSPDSDLVSDEGFVLIAAGPNNVVQSGINPLTGRVVQNNVLSWPYLHDRLFKHDRVLPQGIMNGQQTDFITTRATIKQNKFSTIMDCADIRAFDPNEQIRGALGWGYIQTAELKLAQCNMEFQLYLEKIQFPIREPLYGDFDDDFTEEFD